MVSGFNKAVVSLAAAAGLAGAATDANACPRCNNHGDGRAVAFALGTIFGVAVAQNGQPVYGGPVAVAPPVYQPPVAVYEMRPFPIPPQISYPYAVSLRRQGCDVQMQSAIRQGNYIYETPAAASCPFRIQ
jgi:hypothetical protein